MTCDERLEIADSFERLQEGYSEMKPPRTIVL